MISDDAAIEIVVRNTVSTALNLPCREAINLLRGLLVLGGEHPALDEVRKAYHVFNQSEQQLELIAKQ